VQSTRLQWGEEQKLLASAWTYVDRAYVDPGFNGQDWWKVRQAFLGQPLPNREATYQALRDMLATLGDPFTRFLDPQHYRSLQTSTSGELSGVGLQIAIDEQDHVVVIAPIEGSPAATAGIQSHDFIVAVNGESVQGLSLDSVAELMRGTTGSVVDLTLQREDEIFTVRIVRESIAINPIRTQRIPGNTPEKAIAYLRLSQFNGKATEEVREAILAAEADRVGGYILDLRNNPGGLLQAAIDIAQFWISEGDIVLVTGRNGIQDSISATHEVLTQAPLVVLVNRGSASASEVLAGALQDNGRALLVGTRTFGKGLIQSLFELNDGSGMAVTTAKYLTPSGRDINALGILPDIWVDTSQPLTLETIATDADPQFKVALEALVNGGQVQLAEIPEYL
jgi:carboxyl-terminal processing protease